MCQLVLVLLHSTQHPMQPGYEAGYEASNQYIYAVALQQRVNFAMSSIALHLDLIVTVVSIPTHGLDTSL